MNSGAFRNERLASLIDRNVGATIDPSLPFRRRPMNRILQDFLHCRMKVDWIRFMAGPEIKNFPIAALPSTTGTKNFASFEPGDENDFIRCRNGERFAIHFCVRNFKIAVEAVCNWMSGVANPEPFFFAGFPPCQRAACAHEPFENFRVVRGMESNQTHAFPNAAHHRVRHGIRHLAMRCVPPPKQDVGAFQDRLS